VARLHPIIYCSGKEFSLFNPPSFRGIQPLSENEGRQFLRHAARVRFMHTVGQGDCYQLLSVLKRTMTAYSRDCYRYRIHVRLVTRISSFPPRCNVVTYGSIIRI